MSEQAYLTSAKAALLGVQEAMREAKVRLPEDVILHHWMASKHSPAAWRSVESWYVSRPDADLAVSLILTDLALLAETLACLTTVTQPKVRADGKPDLRLAKVKRAS